MSVAAVEEFTYKTADPAEPTDPAACCRGDDVSRKGLSICIHRPAEQSSPRPAIVMFHGGGWGGRNFHMFRRHCEQFARLGMVAAHADYAPGVLRGMSDARDAVGWFVRNADSFGVDLRRVVLAGGSSGGHIALGCLLAEADIAIEPAAMLLFNPVVDLRGTEYVESMSEEESRRISPLCRLPLTCQPPMLLQYGSEDPYLRSGREFVAHTGSDCELEVYDGAGHGFFNHDPWYRPTLERATRYLVKQNLLTA